MNANIPEVVPLRVPEFGGASIAEIVVTGGGLTMWGPVDTAPESAPRVRVRLQPDDSLIIGRQEGGLIPYMDPNYTSTQIAPDGSSVVTSCDQGRDRCVSRGHFMLRGSARGILFVNGVPRPGGGIRPPVNGTHL